MDLLCRSGEGIALEAMRLMNEVKGRPYLFGGKGKSGFDCSGFVAFVFGTLFSQYKVALQTNVEGFITSPHFDKVDEPKPGDLIIFRALNHWPNHMGIVVSSTHWVGSQSSTGVATVPLAGSWWTKNRPGYFFLRFKHISHQSLESCIRGTPHAALH